MKCMRSRGLSFLEVVLAVFMLTFSLLLVGRVIASLSTWSESASERGQATAIAQAKLAEIRAWAGQRTGFYNFDNWSVYTAATSTVGDYVVLVDSEFITAYSPSTTLEQEFPGAERTLTASLRKVQVEVEWGRTIEHRVRLVTLIGDPVRELSAPPLAVTGGPTTLPPDGIAAFQVELLDVAGNPVPDQFFHWAASQVTGNATLSAQRDGRTAQLTNVYSLAGTPVYTGGICRAAAITHYAEREVSQVSADIVLSS